MSELLHQVPVDRPIWDPTVDLSPEGAAWRLWKAVRTGQWPADRGEKSGMGRTKTSKLLAAKRPQLLPVWDSVVALAGCHEVQRHLSKAGFPCPEPLTGLLPFGDRVGSAETYVPGGQSLPASGSDAEPFAAGLSRLVLLASSAAEVSELDPAVAPPWTAWAHREPGLWP